MNPKSASDPKSHIRVCHCCNHTNESTEPITRCESCSKIFAPFFYFSDENASVYTDNQFRPPEAPGEMRPIRGLSVVWKIAA